MINEIELLLDQYVEWLKDKTNLRQVTDDWVEITTPYLDRHNDYLQIYAKRTGEGYILTDDGYVLRDLKLCGCNLRSKHRQDLLRVTLNGFGVDLSSEALEVKTSSDSFALRKHNLLQAMLAVNDLFYLAEPMVASIFLEDVTSWLDLHEIRYTPRVKFAGKTGYDHVFHFVIPKSRVYPERIVQAINVPKKSSIQNLILQWLDTRDARPPDSQMFAFLNDAETTIAGRLLDALRNYDVRPVPWGERETVKAQLAA